MPETTEIALDSLYYLQQNNEILVQIYGILLFFLFLVVVYAVCKIFFGLF